MLKWSAFANPNSSIWSESKYTHSKVAKSGLILPVYVEPLETNCETVKSLLTRPEMAKNPFCSAENGY